ncbi:MAG TPA: hypothetical protein VNO22_01755 [Planctomycetota bacterium]|nr:hypothetical protein [Planctomycetota bacterium]
MKGIRGIVGVGLLALLAGCASAARAGLPCEQCRFGVPDRKANPPKIYCVVEGKSVDCRKNPPECPECAKGSRP